MTIFLDKRKLSFYEDTKADIVTLPFLSGSIENLDFVDKKQVQSDIEAFIENNKLAPDSSVLVLSPAIYFEKEFEEEDENEQKRKAERFFDSIPFEHTTTKIVKHQANKIRLIATNRDFYEPIKEALEKKGFTITAVLPAIAFGITKKDFDRAAGGIIASKLGEVAKYSLIPMPHTSPTLGHTAKSYLIKKKRNTITIGIVATIIVVVLAFAFVALTVKQNQMSDSAASVAPTKPQPLMPTIVLAEDNLRIELVNSSGVVGKDDFLKNQLLGIGFQNIELGTPSATKTEKTFILFTSNVPLEIREKIIAQVEKSSRNVSTQELRESAFDVVVIIGED